MGTSIIKYIPQTQGRVLVKLYTILPSGWSYWSPVFPPSTGHFKESDLKWFLLIMHWIPKVHAHGDGELLVVDGEDVQDLHVDVHMDGAVRFGGLELLIIERQTEPQHTLEHACTITVEVIKIFSLITFWR